MLRALMVELHSRARGAARGSVRRRRWQWRRRRERRFHKALVHRDGELSSRWVSCGCAHPRRGALPGFLRCWCSYRRPLLEWRLWGCCERAGELLKGDTMEGLHERLEAAVRTPRARHRRIARGSRHARPDVGPQKPFHAAGADCGATLSLCHGVSGLTRASCQYADRIRTIGCRDGAALHTRTGRMVPRCVSERLRLTVKTQSPLRAARWRYLIKKKEKHIDHPTALAAREPHSSARYERYDRTTND